MESTTLRTAEPKVSTKVTARTLCNSSTNETAKNVTSDTTKDTTKKLVRQEMLARQQLPSLQNQLVGDVGVGAPLVRWVIVGWVFGATGCSG